MTAHTKASTMEQLHAIWLRRNRARGWPATFQEAMEHPLYSRVLKIKALHNELIALHRANDSSPVMKRDQKHPGTLPAKPLRIGFWMDTDPEVLDE